MAATKPTIPSVWARERTKREQPALSRDRIVSEAVQLLDEEGIDALSMRTLGTRLNAGATSLYRHVANKDELIELVVDEVYGEVRVPEVSDPAQWRAGMTECAHSLRAVILGHPWLVSVLGQVGLADLGPNLAGQHDRMLALFRDAGFQAREAEQALNTLMAFVIGMTTSEAAYLSLIARSGLSEQEWVESIRPAAEQAAQEHPYVREGFASLRDEDPQVIRDADFRYGVDRILDGLATRLP
ncbi:TetR/AcrR family transcriptional regulator [Nonomuraea sp. NPDC050536]|uniref:TetR/AcrR family transcriptional regulator n=1 Tax=Nonomuraea sp. NPDC050536 TaxID=3364366 RepID=UPI0037C5719F